MPKHPILLEVASSSSDRALWSDGARAVAVRWPFGYRAAISPGTMPRACMNVLVAMPKSDSPLGIPTRYTLHKLDAWVGSASSQESGSSKLDDAQHSVLPGRALPHQQRAV